jgi:hypothetical protein
MAAPSNFSGIIEFVRRRGWSIRFEWPGQRIRCTVEGNDLVTVTEEKWDWNGNEVAFEALFAHISATEEQEQNNGTDD